MALDDLNSKRVAVLMARYENSYKKDPSNFMKKIESSY